MAAFFGRLLKEVLHTPNADANDDQAMLSPTKEPAGANSGCPFHSSSSSATSPSSSLSTESQQEEEDNVLASFMANKKRVIRLYETYVNLPRLTEVWDNPVTVRPELEPCFAAAMHGIELCFLLLTQFLSDDRKYVAKRPRVELVMQDIQRQCSLLAELVDGELEEEDAITAAASASLTQDFPFDGCPPTTQQHSRSPALHLLLEAVMKSLPTMTPKEAISLKKVVRNVTNAFESSFREWTVGIGIEAQLNELRVAVGLSPIESFADKEKHYLDYNVLVRPEVVVETYLGETFVHPEDFFFRTVHLGTECWAYIATRRMVSARKAAEQENWHTAAARVRQAGHILCYLGEHVLMLTSMVLRDYLELKVEIEGTSGEGSIQVKAFRSHVRSLYAPFEVAVVRVAAADGMLPSADAVGGLLEGSRASAAGSSGVRRGPSSSTSMTVSCALLHLYENPDKYPGLYNYTKALEGIESALLGGFYFSHFRLATNVIGLGAKGTMNKAVTALKATYETAVFPTLDSIRSLLGTKTDSRLAHLKGRIMTNIEASPRYRDPLSKSKSCPGSM